MPVTVAEGAGFCFGVQRAVEGIFDLLGREHRRVVTLGPLIHNSQIAKALAERGVETVEAVPERGFDGVVVLRSHGVPLHCHLQLAERGIDSLDLTCPFVRRIHDAVREGSAQGRLVLIVGHADHPEVVGICSFARAHEVFASPEELAAFTQQNPGVEQRPVLLVAQTTFDVEQWRRCKNFVEKVYTNAQISDTICNATENRQRQAAALAADSDAMLVVGARHSSNTNRLYELCRQHCARVLLVESASEIPAGFLQPGDKVGITAGASTPAYVIKEAADKCQTSTRP
ncbi:MAG: 4-hydroxy-3-methylbut-2-enyl diphosphate reductase [Clostridiales bacterium]|mgnify:CR=1 FL=1|nr:4-hydroxy-3-methylbut-2-enyl diphosphate reductase [Clostridiales bacterium]